MKKFEGSLFEKFESSQLSKEYNKMIAGGRTVYTQEVNPNSTRWDTITAFGTPNAALEYTTQERDARSNA